MRTLSATLLLPALCILIAQTDQPQLSTVKSDFIPGEKTVFYDDFTDMGRDEPPPHWKIRSGMVELRTGDGFRQMTAVCPLKPSFYSDTFTFPKDFTVEIEAAFGGPGAEADFFAWPKGVEGGEAASWHIHIAPDAVSMRGPKDEKIGEFNPKPPTIDKPIKVALWVQNGRARGYVDGVRFADVNQMTVPPNVKPADHWTLRERCDRPTDGWIGIRSVRVAESAPDFSTEISSKGRYITHGIRFDTNSSRLKLESAPVFKAVANALDKNPNLKLEIVGYTDSVGDAQKNLALSKERSEAVRSVLVSQFGVDAARLTATGYGADKPIASNDTPEGRAQNRRVEFLRK
jgi:OOP family OmpA-OmpF porin